MTKETLAALLNGREYGDEITRDEARAAKEAGLVVVFGASDDLAEFRGAIDDEAPAGDDPIILIDGEIFMDEDCCCRLAEAARERAEQQGWAIQPVWCGPSGYDWAYETDIPHATFDVMEDGDRFCRGIVFELPKGPRPEASR